VKIEQKVEVAATPAEAFNKLSDLRLLPALAQGVMDMEATDDPTRFRTVIHAGPAPVGGEVEFEFWPESASVVWHSTRGIHQVGRFLVRPRLGGAEVVMRIFYHLDGGLPSRIAEWAVAPTVRRHMKEALRRLQRSIEAQPPRRRRTARPATEAGSGRVMSTSTPASAER
jgi:uncharacterized membrane protein